MIEKGRVVKVDGRYVQVRLEAQAGCAGCASSGACRVAGTVVTAFDRAGISPGPGDLVGVEADAGEQAKGAVAVLGLPLALFAAAYAGGAVFLPAAGEGVHALLGLGGIAAGLGAAALFGRSRKDSALPRLVPTVD